MALKRGYGYDAFKENLAQCERTMPRHLALRTCYDHARASFFRSKPGGALPAWLAFPATHRLREHYSATGAPLSFAPDPKARGFRENPAPALDVARARSLYQRFTGNTPHTLAKVRFPAPPKVGLAFGELLEVGYTSFRDGRPYRHRFKVSARPLLIASSDGRQVLIFGGRYRFTDRGIEDR